ncbi:MAG: phosphonate C-P lyase system protein PhnG [Acidobacteria bacterium]|nr:phosphonate C-P lyase system protein PhnG [Acidobacteriota bacterium]
MAALARTERTSLEDAWSGLAAAPGYAHLRAPEIGMVMVRGRTGGTGRRFNLGEMTVTRCVVRLADGRLGFGYVAGRDRRHAELAALFDALLQDESSRPELMERVILPAEAAIRRAEDVAREKAAATRVQFFTMVRGE